MRAKSRREGSSPAVAGRVNRALCLPCKRSGSHAFRSANKGSTMPRNEETAGPGALLTREWPGDQRDRDAPARQTTLRQVRERINQSRAMVADGLAEVAVLTALQAEMTGAHVQSVDALAPATRSCHREAIRLASGFSDGVEMW